MGKPQGQLTPIGWELGGQNRPRFGGTEQVAYALEDMHIRGPLGDIWMRPDDHQLFEPLFVLVSAKVDGKEVNYDMEGTGIGPKTEARIETSDLKLPTLCKMQRPPK